MTDKADMTYQMRVSSAFLQSIDDWRRQQPDLPPRAEAIRRLVQIGLDGGVMGRSVAQVTSRAQPAPRRPHGGNVRRSPERAALRREVEVAVLAEIGRAGRDALNKNAIAKRFHERGVSPATIYRWVDAAVRAAFARDRS